MMSFVRCAVRVMWTSNVPISISRAFAIAPIACSSALERPCQHGTRRPRRARAGSRAGRSRRRRRCGARRSRRARAMRLRMPTSRPRRSRSVLSACSSSRSTVRSSCSATLKKPSTCQSRMAATNSTGAQRPDLALVVDLLALPIEAIERLSWRVMTQPSPATTWIGTGSSIPSSSSQRSVSWRAPSSTDAAGARSSRRAAPLPRSRRGPARRAGCSRSSGVIAG